MRKEMVLLVIVAAIIAVGNSSFDDLVPTDGNYKKIAIEESLKPIGHDRQIKKIAETMEMEGPIFTKFLGGDVFQLGSTYYDMQHNTTLGRNIALDDSGGAHIAWMYSSNPLLSTRNIRYNYVTDDDSLHFLETGIRCDNAIYKAGYCTIDAQGCTPYVAYHQQNSPTTENFAQLSWDAASIESGGSIHGGFSAADPAPPTIPLPECPTDRPDIEDLWPVISVSEVDNDIHLLTTTSNNDSLDCAGSWISPTNYMGYYHASIDTSRSTPSIVFDAEGLALAESRGISGEIATARTRDEVAVAYMYMGEYECSWPDSTNIFLLRSSDDGASWDTTNITNYGADYRSEARDTHYYADLYILEIDSTVTPYDSTIGWYIDTTVIYSRPSGGLTCFYDEEDYVHVIWTEGSYLANDSCTGNTVSSYSRSNILHWSDRGSGEINSVLSSYPSLIPIPGGDPFHARYFYSSYAPNAGVNLDDGMIYCIWQQYYGERWWTHYLPTWGSPEGYFFDKSSGEYANQEIFISYSPDHGETWVGPLDLSNTYTPNCEAGNCFSELDPTIAKIVDDYVHIAYIEDKDAGISIHEEGEKVNCPVKYARVETGRVRAAADAIDYVSYLLSGEYPDTTIIPGLDSTALAALDSLYWDIIDSNYYYAVKEIKNIDKPTEFDLSANFPNPFNARTMITFDIVQPDDYILEVYNMNGKLVSILANSYMSAGKYSVKWEGTDMLGNPMESGTYLYRLRDSNGKAIVRKMVLIK